MRRTCSCGEPLQRDILWQIQDHEVIHRVLFGYCFPCAKHTFQRLRMCPVRRKINRVNGWYLFAAPGGLNQVVRASVRLSALVNNFMQKGSNK